MALIVQKFGGTSVADLDRIANVADIVERTRGETDTRCLVVLSAMAGETDRLLKLGKRGVAKTKPA